LSDGVVLLDRNAQIIFANAAARALEAEGSLRLRQSLLTYSSSFTQRLTALIKIAVEGDAGSSMSTPTHLRFSFPRSAARTSDGSPI
jgi:hypothetical protein